MTGSLDDTHNATAANLRRPLDAQACGLMLLFCLALGLQQVAIKAVAGDISPLAQIALRSTLALLPVAWVARRRGVTLADLRSLAGPGVLVGLGFTGEFTGVAIGLNYTTASHMAVFLYTAPVFAALGLHWLIPDERLGARHWLGIALAFGGVVLAMAPGGGGADATALIVGDAFGLLAGLSWAATTLVIRRSALSEARPVVTLLFQLATAGALLLPVAALRGDIAAIRPSTPALASLTFQTLGISVLALLLWFALLRRYLASRLGVLSFLTPVFGVAFGALLLDEPLSLNFLLGGIAIIAGVLGVSMEPPPRRRASG